MNEREKKEQIGLPLCPNLDCRESHVVRNGSHRGWHPIEDGSAITVGAARRTLGKRKEPPCMG